MAITTNQRVKLLSPLQVSPKKSQTLQECPLLMYSQSQGHYLPTVLVQSNGGSPNHLVAMGHVELVLLFQAQHLHVTTLTCFVWSQQ